MQPMSAVACDAHAGLVRPNRCCTRPRPVVASRQGSASTTTVLYLRTYSTDCQESARPVTLADTSCHYSAEIRPESVLARENTLFLPASSGPTFIWLFITALGRANTIS